MTAENDQKSLNVEQDLDMGLPFSMDNMPEPSPEDEKAKEISELSKKGYKVGIMDADIYGATIPEMLFMDDASPSVDTINKTI